MINRIPNGYLDLLGTETGGKNPSEAPESVLPVVSMNALYESQTMAVFNFSTNSVNVGDNLFIETPDDQTWLLYNAGFNVQSPLAGDHDVVGLFLNRLPRNDSPGGNSGLIAVGNLLSIGVAQNPADATQFAQPIVLHHGTRIFLQIMQRAGGAANRVVNCSLLIARMQG